MIEVQPTDPEWLVIASEEEGICETPGSAATARIVEYHAATALGAESDEVSWCSAFVNWCIAQAGIKGTNSAAARSWLKWGTLLDQPVRGCVVVLRRGSEPWQGHVGFYLGDYREDYIQVLGGNQGDQVNVAVFSKGRVLGYRWPDMEEVTHG